jgi:hypothetical protein
MASLSALTLEINGSTTVGKSDVTVSYLVQFDDFDRASDQPYHAHLDLMGLDKSVGEPGSDRVLLGTGLGDVRASMAPYPGLPVAQVHTTTVSTGVLNEDPTTEANKNPDEIRADVTLSPLPAQAVGPVHSNIVKLQLA